MKTAWLGLLAIAPLIAADVRVVEEIIAKVNNEIITRGEIERARKQLEQSLRQQGLSPAQIKQALEEADRNALREKIDQLLLLQRARDLNINVDNEVSRYLAEIQAQQKISDPDKFAEFIRQQTGMSYEDFRQQVKDNFLTRRVIQQEVGSKIVIPRSEVEK
ncbi:MAG: SurA N-terminal domain-containing protein, partial [Bryobacteraceae bacterium]